MVQPIGGMSADPSVTVPAAASLFPGSPTRFTKSFVAGATLPLLSPVFFSAPTAHESLIIAVLVEE